MAFGPITSWQVYGENRNSIFFGCFQSFMMIFYEINNGSTTLQW